MKKLLLVAILFITIATFAKAQDKYCSDIIKNARCSTVWYTAYSPIWLGSSMHFNLRKYITAKGTQMYLNIGNIVSAADTPATTVSITFQDKDKLNYTNVKYIANNDTSFIACIALSNSDFEKIKTKKIDFFVVGTTKGNPFLSGFANAVMAYANCMETLKATPAELDPCTALVKTYDDMKNITTYCSPLSELIRVSKTINSSTSIADIVFCLYKNVFDNSPQTVYVKFDDGTVINFPAQSNCVKTGRDSFFYTGLIPLNDTNINNFKQKKVIKYQIANQDIMVDSLLSTALNGWINCLDNLK